MFPLLRTHSNISPICSARQPLPEATTSRPWQATTHGQPKRPPSHDRRNGQGVLLVPPEGQNEPWCKAPEAQGVAGELQVAEVGR